MAMIGRPSSRLAATVIASMVVGGLWVYALSRTFPAAAGPSTSGPAASRPDVAGRPLAGAIGMTGVVPASPAPVVPSRGSGQFLAAPGVGERIGSRGALVRYRIVVEADAQVEPTAFAEAVRESLADRRGWTARGRWSFQRVPSEPADVTIHLATPETTDAICGRHGLRTGGEVSCRGGAEVVINLKRWTVGVPWYADALLDYRRMVVNHEVGHFLGHGHHGCPGPGRTASVMQTQTNGLDGCVRNPWPYPDG